MNRIRQWGALGAVLVSGLIVLDRTRLLSRYVSYRVEGGALQASSHLLVSVPCRGMRIRRAHGYLTGLVSGVMLPGYVVGQARYLDNHISSLESGALPVLAVGTRIQGGLLVFFEREVYFLTPDDPQALIDALVSQGAVFEWTLGFKDEAGQPLVHSGPWGPYA